MPGNDTEPLPQKHMECLKLYANGWLQDGFEFVPNSSEIDTFWKRDEERKRIRLTFREQQMWVHALDRLKASGKI